MRREGFSEPEGWVKLSLIQETSRIKGRVSLTSAHHEHIEKTILSRVYLLREASQPVYGLLNLLQPPLNSSTKHFLDILNNLYLIYSVLLAIGSGSLQNRNYFLLISESSVSGTQSVHTKC